MKSLICDDVSRHGHFSKVHRLQTQSRVNLMQIIMASLDMLLNRVIKLVKMACDGLCFHDMLVY